MKKPKKSSEVKQFGEFDVDAYTGKLRKHGIKIKLQDKPLQILELLLQDAGEVVTRKEICQKLWPEIDQGDLGHRLNVAIAKLRSTLSDSAKEPRFIETIGSRGYCFIIPVSVLDENELEARQVTMAVLSPILGTMTDNRDLLKVLKGELDFVSAGGYHRSSVRPN